MLVGEEYAELTVAAWKRPPVVTDFARLRAAILIDALERESGPEARADLVARALDAAYETAIRDRHARPALDLVELQHQLLSEE